MFYIPSPKQSLVTLGIFTKNGSRLALFIKIQEFQESLTQIFQGATAVVVYSVSILKAISMARGRPQLLVTPDIDKRIVNLLKYI